ncbi:SelB C-terminal domain-containing protein [Candidatus Aminicenantes bacterium AH-873-B07]|nr:SelB C-terminal domain-containing protein [Candidatus Aminicenantes bacterium AH-873-B07]
MNTEFLTHHLDAFLYSCKNTIKNQQEIKIKFANNKIRGTSFLYTKKQIRSEGSDFARIVLYQPLSLKWKDNFTLLDVQKEFKICEGVVLNPLPLKFKVKRKKIEFLEKLNKDIGTTILALTELKGINGLTKSEMENFTGLDKRKLERVCKQLEEKGEIKILSFFPLFVISERTLNFYSSKLIKIINNFHQKTPLQAGIHKMKLKDKLKIKKEEIFQIILRRLERENKIKIVENLISLSNFKIKLTSEEEKILRKIEKLYFEGKLASLSLKDLKKEFNLSQKTLDAFLHLLTERNKIIKVKDGYFIHSHWIDELILKLKKEKKEMLTITDFKKMTNLSRKYAIPLLELLDEMGITQRVGDYRIILK